MDETKTTEKGWESWSNYVLKTLEKLEKNVNSLDEKLNEINLESKTDLVELKTKAGIVAVIAGFIVSALTSILVGIVMYYVTSGQPKHPVDVPKTKSSISSQSKIA